MFSRTLTEACPLASSSKIYVDVTDNSGVRVTHAVLPHALHAPLEQQGHFCITVPNVCELCNLLSSFARGHLPVCALQGEQFEVIPATPLVSQAAVLGDRRTFSVYDLTQKATFGTAHSLNLLIRWKSTEGE